MTFVRCFLAYVGGLALTAALLFRVLPGDTEASDAAAALSPRCAQLMIGPSYIRFGVNTRAFEKEGLRLGHRMNGCKFTRLALRSYELKHDLEALFERRWPRLKRVVVDVTLTPGDLLFDDQNWYTERTVHWHTFRALTWLWQYQWRRSGSFRADTQQVGRHLGLVAMNYLGIGRGALLLKSGALFQRRHRGGSSYLEGDDDVRVFKSDLDASELEVARARLITDKARARAEGERGDADWPRELERLIRRHGYEPVFVYSPVLSTKLLPPLEQAGRRPLVFLDFADPERYPELYTLRARGRGGHLSRDGASAFSRLLARELAKLER